MRRPSTYKKGITLIEAIVGVAILAFAVTGPMMLASQSLKLSRDARNELIATHLAEEGIEVIHSIRDNNSADDLTPSRTGWMGTMISRCGSGFPCVVDITDHSSGVWGASTLLQCTSVSCTGENIVYVNPATSLYRQSLSTLPLPWERTVFTRTVTLVPIDHAVNPIKQVHVIVHVTYQGYGGNIRSVRIADDLYNWFPPLH